MYQGMVEKEELTYVPAVKQETKKYSTPGLHVMELSSGHSQRKSNCCRDAFYFLKYRTHLFWLYVIIVFLIILFPIVAVICRHADSTASGGDGEPKPVIPDDGKIEVLKQEIAKILSDFNKFRVDTNQELEALTKTNGEFNRTITHLQNEVKSVSQENKKIKEDLENFRSNAINKHEELSKEIQSNEDYINNLELKVVGVDSAHNKTKEAVESNHDTIINLKQLINAVNEAFNETKEEFEIYRTETNPELLSLKSEIRSVQSQNAIVYMTVDNNTVGIETLKKTFENVRSNLTEIIESDCGGIITIPTTKESYLLQYKLNRTYSPNEKCLWTVENTEKSIRSQLKLNVELISHGFKENTGLFAFTWNRETSLTSEKLTRGEEPEFDSEGLYLAFTSDNETSTRGTGFLLKITVIHSELRTYGSNLFYRTPSGSHTVSSYHVGDQISIAVNPKTPVTFQVNKVNSEENNDYLQVYEIQAQGQFKSHGSLSGKLKSPLSFSTTDPVLSIFTADHSTNGEGFKISWAGT